MTSMPNSIATTTRVVLLLSGRRPGDGGANPAVRRYRLARVASTPGADAERFAHLKRSHD